MPTTVIADIFSGLPNPEWVLNGELLVHLQQLLAQLPVLEGVRPPQPAPLGYRGLIVRLPTGSGAHEELHVWGGYVQGMGRTLLDSDRALERWLMQSGVRAGAHPVLTEILGEIR